MSASPFRSYRVARALAALAVSALSMLPAGAGARDLVIALKTEPTALDPLFHAFTPNIQVSRTVFETLLETGPDLTLRPGLAESWQAEGNHWTFHLRRGLRFSDGSALSASDVVRSFERVAQVPNSPSSFKIYLRQVDKIEALDPLTVRITTERPNPLLPINMAALPVMSARALAGSVAEGRTTTELNAGEGLIGSGPYRFVAWKRGAEIVFERNPNYWGEQPAWDRIVYRPIGNAASRVAALLSGDVDLIEDPPTDDLERIRSAAGVRLVTKASVRVLYVALDQHGDTTPGVEGADGRNPMRDRRVREAMSIALDRQAIVDRIMGGVATPAGQLLPSPMPGTSARYATPPRPDPERARALLAQAGYPQGFSLVLGTPKGRYINDSKVAQAVAAMWTRIGVKTTVEASAPSVFFKTRNTYAYSAYMAGWATSTGEMSNTLNSLLVTPDKDKGTGTTNRSRYSNPAMDTLVEQAVGTMDPDERAKILARASEMAMDDFAILPLHFEHSVWAMKHDVGFEGRADQMTLVREIHPQR